MISEVDGCFGPIQDVDAVQWDAAWQIDRKSEESFSAAGFGAAPPMVWTAPGQSLGRDIVSASGTITRGATAGKAGEITDSEFIYCELPFGIDLDRTETGTWNIGGLGDNSSGVTPAQIGNVSIHVENPDGLCAFDVSCTVGEAFDQNNQQLSVSGGGLTVTNVEQCFGLILDGDPRGHPPAGGHRHRRHRQLNLVSRRRFAPRLNQSGPNDASFRAVRGVSARREERSSYAHPKPGTP